MVRPPALVTAARHGLVAGSAIVELCSDDALAVVALAQHDHLSGFLAAAVLDGAVSVDQLTERAISDNWHQELLACVALEALVLRTGAALDGAGVRWRLTKGAAVAHSDYPDPAVRTFGDVDIVVHPDDWTPAVNLLSVSGLRREAAGLGPSYEDRYGKGATLVAPNGLQVDLHRRLAIGRFGVTSAMGDLFDDEQSVRLAGHSIPVLTPQHRLLHACFHASLGGFRRLRAFRDVAQLILYTRADWEATFDVARRWRAEAVVAAALVDTWRILELDDAHPAIDRARRQQINRADRRSLAVFGEEQPFRNQALTAVSRLPVYEVPRYLWSLAAPRRALRTPHPGEKG